MRQLPVPLFYVTIQISKQKLKTCLDRELKKSFVRKLNTTALTCYILQHRNFLFILTVTLALILKVKTEFNLGYTYLNRYTETRAPLSHSRLARCKAGLGWKLSNFCSNIWLYPCQKANRVCAAGWSTGGRQSFAASLLHTTCGHTQQLHGAAAALTDKPPYAHRSHSATLAYTAVHHSR